MVKEGYKEVTVRAKGYLIPNDWEAKNVIECFDFKNGKAFYKVGYTNKGKKVIDLMNISRRGKFQELDGKQKFISEENYKKYSDYKLNKNDLIIAMSDMSKKLWILGRTAIIPKDDEYILNQRIGKLSYNGNMNIKFGNYATNSNYFIRQLKVVAKGTAQKYVNTGEIKNAIIFSPPLPEQKKIASILSSVDKAIEKTDEVIEETKELKKGLMQELLTKGIGHSEFKEVKIGVKKYDIPNKWEVKKLEECCEISYGKDQSDVEDENGNYPILGTGGLIGYADDYLYDKASVLIGRKGTIDNPQYMETPFWTIDTLFYTNDFNETYPKWLYYYLNYYDLSLLNEATGVPSLNRNNLYNLGLPYPPLSEQKKIASILSAVDSKIKKEEEYKAKLERLKKGLMQKLLTGEIRVNTEMEV